MKKGLVFNFKDRIKLGQVNFYIYKIINPENGLFYIGKTYDVLARLGQHSLSTERLLKCSKDKMIVQILGKYKTPNGSKQKCNDYMFNIERNWMYREAKKYPNKLVNIALSNKLIKLKKKQDSSFTYKHKNFY